MRRSVFTLIGLASLAAASASAADLRDGPFTPPPRRVVSACGPWGVSMLARLPNSAIIHAEVRTRYDDATVVSLWPSTEASVSERITWAYASRTACGIALGMLSVGEVNSERLWNCECYYARMQATMGRVLR